MTGRVLVAGGTGRLGTLVVIGLAARGMEVRVLTRDPRRAAHLAAEDVEVVTCDVRDRTSTTAAVAGAEVVVSAVQGFAGPGDGSPATVDRDGNMHLIQAARAAGARAVLMSVAGAAPDSPFELFRMKHAAETTWPPAACPPPSCGQPPFSSCGSTCSPAPLDDPAGRWSSVADETPSTSSRCAMSPHSSNASFLIKSPPAARWRSADLTPSH
jgi:Predicted nucleoside-diphosphate-sugar epimerases